MNFSKQNINDNQRLAFSAILTFFFLSIVDAYTTDLRSFQSLFYRRKCNHNTFLFLSARIKLSPLYCCYIMWLGLSSSFWKKEEKLRFFRLLFSTFVCTAYSILCCVCYQDLKWYYDTTKIEFKTILKSVCAKQQRKEEKKNRTASAIRNNLLCDAW